MSKWHLTKDGCDQKTHGEGEIQPPNSRMDGGQRAEITRKMHEKGSSACLQRASMGRKQGNSLQPKRRYSAINGKRSMATNRDAFVSAQESSKLCFTKCLFFAGRNTIPCHVLGYYSCQNCHWADACELQAQGKEYGMPAGKAEQQVQPPWDSAGKGRAGFTGNIEENR